MRVALVTFYDTYATGPRALAAYLGRAGHDVRLICLKAPISPVISRRDVETLSASRRENPYQAVIAREEGDQLCPLHVPVTETEREVFLKELERFRPDVVGFSFLWSECTLFEEFATLVRRNLKDVRIAAGGVCAITNPDRFLSHVDVLCVGEGEEAMAEWLEDFGRTDVAGLWFADGGEPIRNPRRPPIRDLDGLPFPAFGVDEILIENNAASRLLMEDPCVLARQYMPMSGRRCPFRCSYCVEGGLAEIDAKRGKPARRTAGRFVAELKAMAERLPMRSFEIWDPVFAWDEAWLEDFAERYVREVGIPFTCYACPQLVNERIFQLLRKAGCRRVGLGVQSLNRTTLEQYYHRPFKPEKARQAVEWAYRAGIECVGCDFIVDSPYDDEEGLERILDFLLNTPKPVYTTLGRLVRYPGTPIARMEPPGDLPREEVRTFWYALMLLAHLEPFHGRALRSIAADPLIRANPKVLDEFLATYVRRLRYLSKDVYLEYERPRPEPEEVGRWPALRAWIQERFPRWYIRQMIRRKRAG